MSNVQRGRIRLAGAVGAAAAGLGGLQGSNAAVIYTPVDADVPPLYQVNLDGDGTNEFDITTFGGVVKVGTFASGAGVARDGNLTANLAPGTLVDSSLDYGAPTNDALTGSSGNFQVSDGPGFIGVRFQIAGNTHYGYVGYEGAGAQASANGHVFLLAYESTADTALQTIPEPMSLALLAAGTAGLAAYRRRKSA